MTLGRLSLKMVGLRKNIFPCQKEYYLANWKAFLKPHIKKNILKMMVHRNNILEIVAFKKNILRKSVLVTLGKNIFKLIVLRKNILKK